MEMRLPLRAVLTCLVFLRCVDPATDYRNVGRWRGILKGVTATPEVASFLIALDPINAYASVVTGLLLQRLDLVDCEVNVRLYRWQLRTRDEHMRRAVPPNTRKVKGELLR